MRKRSLIIGRGLVVFFLWCHPALAWNAQDHHAMGKIPLEEVASEWGLLAPCPIHPITSLLEKVARLDETLGDFWHFSDFLKINPTTAWDQLALKEQGKDSITPLEILSLHSTDADDGRDQNLIIRDRHGNPHYAFQDQFWFGSLTGGNSQAFRHLEKPPFSWRYPDSTFGFPFRAVGEATTRAQIYAELSLLAFELQEDYWGWRFLAGAFHYLQDLHNPYHSAQITPELLKKGLKAYWSWGHREHKGLMPTLAHIVSNSHRFLETYLEKTPNYEPLTGHDTLPINSMRELSIRVRDESNRFFPDLSHAVSEITDEQLEGPHLFNSNTEPYDDPLPYLHEGPQFARAHAEIVRIVNDRFASTGRVLRTAVWQTLQAHNQPQDPKAILKTIAELVALHPQQEP